jgi:NAD(P)-dependent dehydrogenase (short-subunit alcohol dehydrogenase family)
VLFPDGGRDEFRQAYPDRFAAFAAGDFPRGRLVEPREVADTACFLLSPRASGINGANSASTLDRITQAQAALPDTVTDRSGA